MKSTVEHLNPTRVKLSVEVPFDELKPHFTKAYGALAGTVNIPGFRKGKVPSKILDARLGRGTILSEVVNDAVPVKYGEAVAEQNLTPLGQPDIEVTKIEDGDILEFTAEVDIRPGDRAAGRRRDRRRGRRRRGHRCRHRRAGRGTARPVRHHHPGRAGRRRRRFGEHRSARRGDGEDLPDASTDGLTYKIGTGDLVDGLDDALVGLSAGESDHVHHDTGGRRARR